MLETNIRLLNPGQDLYLWTRRAEAKGPDITPDLLQRACGTLRHRHGLAAIPARDGSRDLLVVAIDQIKPIHLEAEGWELDVEDSGAPARRLALTDAYGPELLPSLIERALEARLARTTGLWTLDSPRIWYEPEPFVQRDRIAAYRRNEVSAVLVEGEGIGVSVDIGTAFFTIESLAYFFDHNASPVEGDRRSEQFAALTKRQEGQKGTLVYDNGRSRTRCYFESAPQGITCATTGSIRVKGKSHDSLLAYYRAEYPDLIVDGNTPAVRVSFRGLARPQYVAADRLRARVMNEDVPEVLSSVDKISPAERRGLVERFWDRLGTHPLGRGAPSIRDGFWRPTGARVAQLMPPALTFGKGHRLEGPCASTMDAYRTHFRQRSSSLEKNGCYSAPSTMPRTLYYAYPKAIDACIIERLAADLTEAVRSWSRVNVCSFLVPYENVDHAASQLRTAEQSGMAVFVLDDEPVAYHEAAHQLGDWRLKRVTERTLRRQYDGLMNGVWDKRLNTRNGSQGSARWRSFITLNALDVLQLLDAIPFRSQQAGSYEAHLVVDVGYDRRHFALSLLIARRAGKSPDFRLVTHVEPKADHQHEIINAAVLRDQVIELVQSTLRRPCDPIESFLVLRDGVLGPQEIEGIDQAMAKLMELGKVSADARIDFAELHKDTLKSLRLWEVDADGTVQNPLEGSAVQLNAETVLLTTTGAGTLHQGTADPVLIVGNGRCSSTLDVARAVFDAAQLNWSSPSVAQRLHVALKRTDEELKAYAAREIRRLR